MSSANNNTSSQSIGSCFISAIFEFDKGFQRIKEENEQDFAFRAQIPSSCLIKEKTEQDIAKIQMEHLRTSASRSTIVFSTNSLETTNDLMTRIEQLELEKADKDRQICQLQRNEAKLQQDLNREREINRACKDRISFLEDAMHKLQSVMTSFANEVQVMQDKLPKIGDNNQEDSTLRKFVNSAMKSIGITLSLIPTHESNGQDA